MASMGDRQEAPCAFSTDLSIRRSRGLFFIYYGIRRYSYRNIEK